MHWRTGLENGQFFYRCTLSPIGNGVCGGKCLLAGILVHRVLQEVAFAILDRPEEIEQTVASHLRNGGPPLESACEKIRKELHVYHASEEGLTKFSHGPNSGHRLPTPGMQDIVEKCVLIKSR